jgi:hypothetical protein
MANLYGNIAEFTPVYSILFYFVSRHKYVLLHNIYNQSIKNREDIRKVYCYNNPLLSHEKKF